MDGEALKAQIGGLSVLDHALTRRAYELVLEQGEVSRDTAAEAMAVARSVAAFHLDKLTDVGLLTVRYERTSGRTGPGAGRPAKLYARSDREIDLSIPPRRYDLAGAVLADAISRAQAADTPVATTLTEVALETGEGIGRAGTVANAGAAPRSVLLRVLEDQGYEPDERDGEIALVNCPFHRLADRQRALVCGMNLDLLTGVLSGTGMPAPVEARLAPESGYCCVRLTDPADPADPADTADPADPAVPADPA
jgi:predicted ArsR family transcriptional regulator